MRKTGSDDIGGVCSRKDDKEINSKQKNQDDNCSRLGGTSDSLRNQDAFRSKINGITGALGNQAEVWSRLGGVSEALKRQETFWSRLNGITSALEKQAEIWSRLGGINDTYKNFPVYSEITSNIYEKYGASFLNDGKALPITSIEPVVNNYVSVIDASFNYGDVLSISPQGKIIYNDETFNKEDIEKRVEAYISDSKLLSSELSLEQRINNYLHYLHGQHPLICNFLLYILLPFVISLSVNCLSSDISEAKNITINNYGKLIIKGIKREIPIDLVEMKDIKCRIVSKDNLKVYKRKKVNSAVVYRLQFGDVVQIVLKHRNWSYIRYFDHMKEEYIEGWTLTRYLARTD